MKKRTFSTAILFLCVTYFLQAQQSLQNQHWQASISDSGTLVSLSQNKNGAWKNIPLQSKEYSGFAFYYVDKANSGKQIPITLTRQKATTFNGNIGSIQLSLEYKIVDDRFVVIAAAENKGSTAFAPQTFGLKTGISNYMENYPQWNDVYFPTMLRCEKTHFTGYLQTPNEQVLAVASPNAVAAYSLDYNFGYGDPKGAFFWGHRIYTFNLDFINANPLPARHPQNLSSLAPNEKRTWTIYLSQVENLQQLSNVFSELTDAPSFDIPVTTFDTEKPFFFSVYSSSDINVSVQTPDGRTQNVNTTHLSNNFFQVNYQTKSGAGIYTFFAKNKNGKVAEAKISVLKPYGWYLQRARLAALKYTQKASWNCENWYGFYSAYLAQQYFPDAELNRKTNKRFYKVMALMYDTAHNWEPIKDDGHNASRIQNHTTTVGILVDKYLAEKNVRDLQAAKHLANWIIDNSQTPDGAYRNRKTHYTSVIYIAKSIMELMAVEKALAKNNNEWQHAYDKHYNSVKRAIDQLTQGFGAIDTEGELTFEDGMISCSALQIAQFALLQTHPEQRKIYIDAAEKFLVSHQCLEQLYIADSRMRGGSLRFWEAQYDVLFGHNFMNSPHGWSAWATYANYYLYLLTGKEEYLVKTINAVGSGMQLIDFKIGDLRWAFCTDPYINTIQARNFDASDPDKFQANQYSPFQGKHDNVVVGEQYVNMIADKFYPNSSDNDVHEQFKCMAEVVLTSAYILERKDGSLVTLNCVAKKKGNTITVTPNEKVISKLHLNFVNATSVKINWNKNISKQYTVAKGLQWINQL